MKVKKIIKIIIIIIIVILTFCFIMKNFFPAEWSFITPHKQGDFVRVGNAHSYFNNASSVLLNDGRVLIVSGNDIELFSPKTRRFKKIKIDRNKINNSAKLVKLENGDVLLIGGIDSENKISNKTFIFNPQHNVVYSGPNMLIGRVNHSAILTNEGRVFIVGGVNNIIDEDYLNTTEFYNPETNKFEFGPKLPEKLRNVVLVRNKHNIYMYGGMKKTKNNDGSVLHNKNVYVLEKNSIKLIGSTIGSGFGMLAYGVGSNMTLLYDGYNSVNKKYMVELYDVKTNTSSLLRDDLHIYNEVTPVSLHDNSLLFVGGTSGFGLSYKEYKDAYIFNYKINKLSKINSRLNFARNNAKAIILQDKNILIFGGVSFGLFGFYPAEIYMFNNKIEK